MTRSWDELRPLAREIVAECGVLNFARKTHMSRANVYKLLYGDTQRPHAATMQAIEQVVSERSSHSRHSQYTDPQ